MAELALPTAVLEEVRLERPLGVVFLVNRSPEPGSAGVPPTARLVLELLGYPGTPVPPEQIEVWVDGEPAFVGAGSPSFGPGYAQPNSEAVEIPGGVRIAVQPL